MNTLPLSCSDFTFPLLPHHAVFRLIRDLGLQAVDIGLFAGRSHLRPEHVKGREEEAARDLVAILRNLDLEVADVFVQTGTNVSERAANHPDATQRSASREIFLSAVRFAAACGSKHITGLPGTAFDGVDPKDSLECAIKEAAWRSSEAAKRDLIYAIEPHVGSMVPTPPEAARFAAESGVKLTLDYGHFVSAGIPNESIHSLLEHASHFHARGGAPGKLQAAVSENTIDFLPAVEWQLKGAGHRCICLEYVWIDWEGCNRVDNISETSLLRDLLRRQASELK